VNIFSVNKLSGSKLTAVVAGDHFGSVLKTVAMGKTQDFSILVVS
jgi:hypothetical protein